MMKKLIIVLFTAVLSFAFLAAPGFLEARGGHGGHGGHGGGGHGGGHHGGFHGGHRGGSHGGYRAGFHGGGFYRGPRYYGGFGFGAAYYLAPWGWYYPGYYPGYYYNVPPAVYDEPPAIEPPLPEYIEPPPATQGSGPGYVLPPPPTTIQIPATITQGGCQIWAPTGEFHNESSWNPQKQMMETVSVPNFAWQDYPCE